MLRRLPVVALCFCATSAVADTSLKVEKSYGLTGTFAALDGACIAALLDTLVTNYDGVEGVTFGAAPAISQLGGVDATLASYSGVAFTGRYGDAKGNVVCVFPSGKAKPTDIEITYEGLGLPGFLKYPLRSIEKEPSKWRAASFAATLSN